MGEITFLLKQFRSGDGEAEAKLFHLVYADLRRMAVRRLRQERPYHTLQPSALVNEAYLKLNKARDLDWQDRAHFFAVAARAMRQILIDYAKRGTRARRPLSMENCESVLPWAVDNREQMIDIDRLLRKLSKTDPRQCSIVELHVFAGFTFQEIAAMLSLSERTVRQDWELARTWLHLHLRKAGAK